MAVLPGTQVLTSAPLYFSFLFVRPHTHSKDVLVRVGPSLLLFHLSTAIFFTTCNMSCKTVQQFQCKPESHGTLYMYTVHKDVALDQSDLKHQSLKIFPPTFF